LLSLVYFALVLSTSSSRLSDNCDNLKLV
jgi:hypothetical protein